MLMNNSHDRYSDIDCITWTCLHCVQDERKMRLRLVEEAISLIASSSLPKASGQRLWTYGAHSFYTQISCQRQDIWFVDGWILCLWFCLQDPSLPLTSKDRHHINVQVSFFFLCYWLLQMVSWEHESSPSWGISEQTEGWSLHHPRQREHSGGFHPLCQVSCHFNCLKCIFC